MTVTEVGTPPTASTNTTTAALAQTSVSPPAGSLVVALVSIGNSSGAATTVTGAMTDSVDGATGWTLIQRFQTPNTDGTAEIWCKDAWSGSRTVTLTSSGGTIHKGNQLAIRFCGGAAAAAAQNGAIATAAGTIGAVSITPEQTGSMVYAALSRNAANGARTINGTSTNILNTADATNGETYSACKLTATTTSGVAASVGYTTTGSQTIIVAVEIVPTSAPAGFAGWGIPMHA